MKKTYFLLFIFLCNLLYASDDQFIESKQCISCHATQVETWKKSHHFHAMAPIDSATNLGDFSDVTLKTNNVTARFYKKDEQFFMQMPDLSGKTKDFEVTYTFGYKPLQQYIVKLPNGKIQLLSFAWDRMNILPLNIIIVSEVGHIPTWEIYMLNLEILKKPSKHSNKLYV